MKTNIRLLLRFKKNHLFLLFMLTSLAIYSSPPDWEPPTNMQYSMKITALLQLEDGTFSTNGNDMVAGFVGNEIRGVASPTPSGGNAGRIVLTITSNQISGELVTFKAYLDDEDLIVNLDQTIVFVHSQNVGSVPNPFIFTYDPESEVFSLTLTANPAEGGSPAGSGFYEEEETVNISANVSDNYIFTNWTGDTEYLDDPLQASATFNMPDDDVELTANFIPQVPFVQDVTETYDGTEHTVMASVPGGFTLRWYNAAAGGSITTIPSGTNAGTYTAWAVSVDGNNLESERVQATLIINKSSLTITANDQTKVVGQEFIFEGNEFTADGLVDNGTDEVTLVSLTSAGAPAGASVGTYPIIPSNATGTGLNNYNISYENGLMNVTPENTNIELTLEGLIVANKTYDGNITATITSFGTLTGIEAGDDVSIVEGAVVAEFSDKNAGIDKIVNISNLILTGDDAYKYSISDFTVTASINPRELVLSNFTASNKVYDGTTDVSGAAFSDNRIAGDILEFDFTAAFTNPNAGTNKTVNFTGITISGGSDANNYQLVTTSGQTTAVITTAPLTVTANDKEKVYDGQVFSGFSVVYNGFVPGENESVLQGTLVFSGAATTAIDAGDYEIIPGNLTSGNYSISFISGTLTITKAALTVTADDKTKVYNAQTFNAFTVSYSGFVWGDGPGDLQGSLSFGGTATSAVNVGNHTIVPQGLTSINYNITFVSGTLTITPASLTITADNKSKVYNGQVFTAFTVSYSGFAGDDDQSDLQGTLQYNGNAVTAVNAGTYQIIPGGLTSNNYTINFVSGTLSITRASLTVTADDKTKTYNGQLFTAFTVSYSGFVSGDGPGNLQGTLTFSGSATTAINVGAYIINPGGLTSNNYNISYLPGALSIVPAALSVTADDKTKVYDGGVFQGFTVSYSGFISGDGPSDLQGTLSFTGAAVTAVNVGSYIINPQGLSSPNYNISYFAGLLSITSAQLTITAEDQVKPFGVEFVFTGTEFNVQGLVDNSSDNVTSVTLFSNGAPASAPVGNYPVIASNAQGQGLSNYSITYVQGTLSVTDKILLTLSGLTVENKVYDGTRTATVSNYGTLVGVLPGTDVQLNTSQAIALFNTKNAGNNKTVTITGLLLSGDDAAMYTIGSQTTQANITPRTLNLIGFVSDNKVYDGTTAATGGSFQDNRIAGDVLNFSFNYAFENANAGVNKQVLFTNIAISGGTDQNNYTLATNTGNATATISPRPLSVKADDKTKKFGEVDPALTWTITAGSLISGDNISGQLQRQSGENIGTYAIQQGTLTAGGNYSINFTPGVFYIVPADLIVTLEPQAAVTAGAQWSIDGVTWYSSGFALPLAPGNYTVQFSEIDPNAWYTPGSMSIEHGSQTVISATYIPKFFLTMLAPDGNGTVTPQPGIYEFPVGAIVNLSASADENWIFQHWLINGSTVTNNPYNLLITEDVTVQAVFNSTLIEVLLTINVTGEGTVNVNGNEYTQPMIFAEGSQITLEALAAAGYYFVEWDDDLSGNENPVTLTMDDDKTITAVFLIQDFTVTFIVKDENDQNITDAIITFDGTVYPAGQYFIDNLTSGTFDWEVSREGYYTETGSVEVNGSEEVTVILESSTYELEIVHEGTGTTNPAEGIHWIEKNTMVTLTAQTTSVSIFTKWEIDGNEYFEEEIEIFMDSDKLVTAFFENLPSYMLTVIVEGEGITDPEEGEHHYAYDEVVTVTATHASGNWVFVKWVVDDIDYFESEINVLMNSDKIARAFYDLENFIPELLNEKDVIIYPVPSKDRLNLRFETGIENARIEIYDIKGRLIIIKDLLNLAAGQATTFDVSSFEPGVYNMKIIVKTHVITRRFIVN